MKVPSNECFLKNRGDPRLSDVNLSVLSISSIITQILSFKLFMRKHYAQYQDNKSLEDNTASHWVAISRDCKSIFTGKIVKGISITYINKLFSHESLKYWKINTRGRKEFYEKWGM